MLDVEKSVISELPFVPCILRVLFQTRTKLRDKGRHREVWCEIVKPLPVIDFVVIEGGEIALTELSLSDGFVAVLLHCNGEPKVSLM